MRRERIEGRPGRRRVRRLLLGVLALPLAIPAPAAQTAAQGNTPPAAEEVVAGRHLVVGTKQAPPFAIRGEDGTWTGISIDLWRQLAQDLGVTYELREVELTEIFDHLAAGRLDAAVAALTVTAEREAVADFSHPYYTSGLGIAVVPRRETAWLAALRGLVAADFLKAVGALALLLFTTGLLVWAFERRRNPEHFGGGAVKGLGAAFWWSAVTMTTVGYGDKAPVTPLGRLVALLWMFASIILISGFTAAIASGLTVASLGSPVEGPQDLPQVRVAAPAGSTSEAYLEQHRVPLLRAESPSAALAALKAGEVEAVVYDAPILRYLLRQEGAGDGGPPVQILGETFELQSYAVALPQGSPLREPLNRALLGRTDSSAWREIQATYLGEE